MKESIQVSSCCNAETYKAPIHYPSERNINVCFKCGKKCDLHTFDINNGTTIKT